MNNTSQITVPFGEPYPNVTAAVAALTQPQLNRLAAIAQRRLENATEAHAAQRLQVQNEPADFVHEAILLVLAGKLQPGRGRRTHPRHLASPFAFFNFLQGVIHSRIHAQLITLAGKTEHLSADTDPAVVLLSQTDVVKDVQLNEIKRALSARLRAHAGDHAALQATLRLLELEGTDARQKPSRDHLRVMRKLGREVLQELAAGETVKDLLLA